MVLPLGTDSIGVVCVLIHRAETLVRDEVDEARRTIVQVALENGKDRYDAVYYLRGKIFKAYNTFPDPLLDLKPVRTLFGSR